MTAGSMSFGDLPDLASRALGGSVVFANDELFAEKENLIKPGPAAASAAFGHKGKVYDGWETRRRREPGNDWAIVRLGVPGVVRGVVIDTAYFTGNYPPHASVEGAEVSGYPDPWEISEWLPLLGRVPLLGDTANPFEVTSDERVTHVRLSIYPDGGVARFRVHGEPRPEPQVGSVDLAAGGSIIDCSNRFYSAPENILQPGPPTHMGDGWENARRRDDGNDYVVVGLAVPGRVQRVEIDTTYFIGNAPGWASLTSGPLTSGAVEILPRTRLQPDTRHEFLVSAPESVSQVRLDVFPDGGIARLRVWGEPDD